MGKFSSLKTNFKYEIVERIKVFTDYIMPLMFQAFFTDQDIFKR